MDWSRYFWISLCNSWLETWAHWFFVHDNCYIKFCSPMKLAQAKKQKEKQSAIVVPDDESSFNSSTTVTDESFSSLPPKRTLNAGIVYDKTKWIWCFKGLNKKHPNRKSSKWHFISSHRTWSPFKNHTILLKDEIRTRITTLIDFIDSHTDPFAIVVQYQHSCWQEHVTSRYDYQAKYSEFVHYQKDHE